MAGKVPGSNKMTFEEYHKLTLFFQQKRELYLEERPTVKDVAIEATRELGFKVGEPHVERIKKMLGIKWFPKRPDRQGSGNGEKRSMMRVVVSSLLDLYNQLGASQPPALLTLFDTLSKPREKPRDVLAKEAQDNGLGNLDNHKS